MIIEEQPLFNLARDTYWEIVANSRWGRYISEVEERVILMADQIAPRSSTALEVGCEGVRWTNFLALRGWKMTCTDINPETLAVCQARIPSANCILVQPQDNTLPCTTASQSLVLCIEVGNVLRSDWFSVEVSRILFDGGLVVGVFENRLSFRGEVRHIYSTIKHRIDYYKEVYPTWKKKLCQQGFKMVYEEGICWFPFSRASNSRLIPFFAGLERRMGLRHFPDISPWIVFLAQKKASE